MMSKDEFYLNKAEPNRSCFLALRGLILDQDTLITETIKYGMPCFCFKDKAFCYLWKDKKIDEPYILFVEGNQLEHPQLETGGRARMKILRVNPNKDLPKQMIEVLLCKALDLYRVV